MTLFAGIFSRAQEASLPARIAAELPHLLSRNTDDRVRTFHDSRCVLVGIDIGAFGEAAFLVDENGAASALAGEPLLGHADARRSRSEDLKVLHARATSGSFAVLGETRGVFCAVHYQPEPPALTLISDRLGIRPIYYWIGEDYVVFATALRVLEALAEVPKQLDARAVAEVTCFGFPLGDRTPYSDIAVLRAAEIVRIAGDSVSKTSYWRWDAVAPATAPEPQLTGTAYELFRDAVTRRQRHDQATSAFLSGGLDSRCVVAALREQGVTVHTFNFSPAASQDRVFGAEFAREIGSVHHEIDPPPGSPRWSMMLSQALDALNPSAAEQRPERPRLVWSGDGGSVGVGHVYMTQRLVQLLRSGKQEEAVEHYLDHHRIRVPRRILRGEVSRLLADVPRQGIAEELDRLDCADPGRSFHLFLMLNDQRRHLAMHFEDIDLHRLEFQLPFYDSAFLELIVSAPLEFCLEHRFYNRWLRRFPPPVTAVPWQAYPGHEPCWLPVPEGLHYQWEQRDRAEERARRNTALLEMRELLRVDDFPHSFVDRKKLRLAAFIHRLGLRDYRYCVQFARTFQQYWARSGGRFVLPAPAGSDAGAAPIHS